MKKNVRRNLIYLSMVVVILFLFGLVIYLSKTAIIKPFAAAADASLSLVPPTATVNTGETFDVAVVADPSGVQAASVDVWSIHFDTNYLEAQSFTHGDSIFSTYMSEDVNNNNGTVSFSALLGGGQYFTTPKIVGTIRFLTKAPVQNSAVTFDCCSVGQSGIKEYNTGVNLLTSLGQARGGVYNIQTPGAKIINASAKLQGLKDGGYATTNVAIMVYNPNSNPGDASIITLSGLDLSSTGFTSADISSLPDGIYDFKIKVPGYLTNVKRDVDISNTLNIDFGTLMAGDINNDGQVNGGDFSLLSLKWFQADPTFVTDINHDGQVNGGDFSLLSINWFKQNN